MLAFFLWRFRRFRRSASLWSLTEIRLVSKVVVYEAEGQGRLLRRLLWDLHETPEAIRGPQSAFSLHVLYLCMYIV